MISVIIPIYRVEKYISACIQSVLAQTYEDFELILVDDGSPDRSAQIAEDLLKRNQVVQYRIVHTENRGVSAARNKGMSMAKGDYIVMVDSDDVLSPDFLQEFADMIERRPGLNIYSCGFSVVDENNWQTFAMTSQREQVLSWEQAQRVFLERKIRFLLPTFLLSRAFIENNGICFDEFVRYSEDVQFIWRCLAYNRCTVYHSFKKMYNYILHPGSTMTASGITKILTCCSGLDRLLMQISDHLCPTVRDQLAMRTYFSVLHGAAHMMDAKEFSKLYEQAQCEPYIIAQAKSGKLSLRVLAVILLMSRTLGYQIMRKF